VCGSLEAARACLAWNRHLAARVGAGVLVPAVGVVASLRDAHAHGHGGVLTPEEAEALAAACGQPAASPLPALIFRDGGVFADGVSFHGLALQAATPFAVTFGLVMAVGQVLLNNVARLADAGAPHLHLTPHHVTAGGRILDVAPEPEGRLRRLRAAIAAVDPVTLSQTGDAQDPWGTVPLDLWVAKHFVDMVRRPAWAATGLAVPAAAEDAPRWATARHDVYQRLAHEFLARRHAGFWLHCAAAVVDMQAATTDAAMVGALQAAGRSPSAAPLQRIAVEVLLASTAAAPATDPAAAPAWLAERLHALDRDCLVQAGIVEAFMQDRVLVATAYGSMGYVALLDELAAAAATDPRRCLLHTLDLQGLGPWGFAATCAAGCSAQRLAGVGARRATDHMQRTTCNMQRTTCNAQLASSGQRHHCNRQRCTALRALTSPRSDRPHLRF
jgi:hypothetical protein